MHRRTFLRGAGAALALPWLEAMAPPLTATARAATTPPKRLGFVYIPHGVIMNQWTPAATGADFEFTPILKPLEPYKDDLIVVSNLTRAAAVDNHACSASAWLTGVAAKRTDGPDFFNGVSVDQVVAKQIGQDTLFPTLELATEDFTGLVGACDPGYSCAYMNTLAWATPTTPLPTEINPRVVFKRLFGRPGTDAQRATWLKRDRSILDSITEDANDLQRVIGAQDRLRLTQYLDNLREIERRIQLAEAQNSTRADITAPVGVPESYEEHVDLLFDLLAVAYQADLSRVFTFMLAREASGKSYPNLGITDTHHAISHHGEKPAKIAEHAKLNLYHISLFAKFLQKLDATPDGDGTLLDHAAIFYGSGMSNGNAHSDGPLPVIALGGALGKGHRHIRTTEKAPIGNLWMSVADKFGAPVPTVGDSTGEISL